MSNSMLKPVIKFNSTLTDGPHQVLSWRQVAIFFNTTLQLHFDIRGHSCLSLIREPSSEETCGTYAMSLWASCLVTAFHPAETIKLSIKDMGISVDRTRSFLQHTRTHLHTHIHRHMQNHALTKYTHIHV